MTFHKIIRISEKPRRADKSAVGTINRPLRLAGLVCSSTLSAVGAIHRPLRLVHGHAVEMVEWQMAMQRDEEEKK